jgi:DDE_Tnp_1-associated/Transposase DDE domain
MTPRTAVAGCASSPIAAVAHRLTAPAALAPDQCRSLLDDLAHIADPRHRRGRRHALGTVPAVAVAAVLAGARSLAAIGEWAADAPGPVLAALGARRDPLTGAWRPPAEATVRRVLARVDPDALDQVIGRWLADQQPPVPATRPPPATRVAWRQAVAVDGKTLRGSGHHPKHQVHLLAAMDHTTRAVLGQTHVDHSTNEIARFRPLLEGLDLAEWVVTADALHTQREHADWLVTHKHAAYVLIVKATSPPSTTSWPPCRGATFPSWTRPATAATPAWSSAACRSPPSLASTSPTPPRRSASPAGSAPSTAAAGAP